MKRLLLWTAVLLLGLLEAGCFVRGPRCGRGRVYRGGMCVCPAPYAWSQVQRRCVRPGVVVAPPPVGPAGPRRVVCDGGRVYVGGRCVCRSPWAWSAVQRRCVRPGVVVSPNPRVRPGPRYGPGPRVRPGRRYHRRPARQGGCPGRMVRARGRCVCPAGWAFSRPHQRCIRSVRVRPR